MRVKELTDKAHWTRMWSDYSRVDDGEALIAYGGTFDKILSKFLPVDASMTAIELGCYPGSFLAYLHNRYGYRVCGLDYMDDLERVRRNLAQVGVRVDDLICADLLSMDLERTFDVVASFGLVEHFLDPEDVVNRHCQLVAPGGYLVIEMPHFRGLQYWLHRCFDSRNLSVHNVHAMRPRVLREWVERRGFDVLTCGYFKTFKFWVDYTDNRMVISWPLHFRATMRFARVAEQVLASFGLDDIPNPVLSPYIVMVARRTAALG